MSRYGNFDTDENQPEIIRALETAGAKVQRLDKVGCGVPDLLVAFAGRWTLLEVKNPAKRACDQALTAAQRVWHRDWAGVAPFFVVFTPQQALRAIGAME